jgi:UDP-N-acetylglucosamine--N-acetylmuramyl-(pentapeptide) pyrophosphoryl-undecaprenol N-acetylglucosamine transferase
MNWILAGGGTGGHIFPLIALAQRALERGVCSDVLFMGSQGGMEERVVKGAGFRLEALPVAKVRGGGWWKGIGAMTGLLASVPSAKSVIRRFNASVVIGSGGFAAASPVVAARMAGVPVVLLEQNAIPGATNRYLSRFACRVCVAHPMAMQWFPAWKVVMAGNPVRSEVLRLREVRSDRTRDGWTTILVLGGSQGARFLNQEAAKVLMAVLDRAGTVQVIHQCGRQRATELPEGYGTHERVQVVEYIEDMAEALTRADLVVCRAGAMTISELTGAGVPAILVPFPLAADNHQEHNAMTMVASGGGILVRQPSFVPEEFLDLVLRLIQSPAELERMALCSGRAGILDATDRIIHTIQGVRA